MVFFLYQKDNSIASCVGDETCINGCCRNNPCLNGGTCNEICEPTSVRYNCSCPTPFAGKHCEIQLRSCKDYKAAGVDRSGLYKIIDNTNQTLQVFCDFNSEPGFAWNLIESFSQSNKHLFQVNSLTELEENLLHDQGPLLGVCNYPYSCHGVFTDRSIFSMSSFDREIKKKSSHFFLTDTR